MFTLYVSECIESLSRVAKPNDPEWLSNDRTTDGRFIIESKKFYLTRYMAVYRQRADAEVSFEESKAYCVKDSHYEKISLWEVTALTHKGAAKKILKGYGTLINKLQLGDDQLQAKKLNEIKGELLLTAFERGASSADISEISKEFDTSFVNK
ncbi:hypothetical protein L4X63_21190 [Geomonas sp. Red32]|uniref:hypothetical protein n=1 Tax=Geomonas sp. Red32 TaxID=2912856 RepID=UPI00202CB055|nr:hypothetical protein [Geomonas sp. Red32]MCM0084101.1 hypothetical protein [Geomonas sp. Red32]